MPKRKFANKLNVHKERYYAQTWRVGNQANYNVSTEYNNTTKKNQQKMMTLIIIQQL